MIQIQAKDFDMQKICNSGQCFRMWELEEGRFAVIASGSYLEVSQSGESLALSCSKEEFQSFWRSYFALDEDYAAIRSKILPEDLYMQEAAAYSWGIRILRQELWETLIAFIISQQNNIPRIRKSMQMLAEKYGEEKRNFKDEIFYAFPTPESLMALSDEELKSCGLGYRGKYIRDTAAAAAEGRFDPAGLLALPYEDAKKELMKLYGVGVKVAECICLFALHHCDAFPIDTHIQRVLERHYADGFPFEQYKGAAGILQQLAFYHDLNN